MRREIEKLGVEDRKRHTEVYLWAEVARCGVLDPRQTYEALSNELQFMRDLVIRYEMDGEESWEIDPIHCTLYYGVD